MAKRKTKPPKPEKEDLLGPTLERLRQYADIPDKFQTDTGRFIKRLNPVEALFSNDEISPEGYLSANLYLKDWYDAGFAGKGGVDLSVDRVDSGGSADAFNAKRMDAARRFSKANEYIGPEYAMAMSCMVLDDMSVTVYARDKLHRSAKGGNPAEWGRKALAKAVNRLAGFYGPSVARPRPKMRGELREDARPMVHPFHQDVAA